MKDKTVFCCDNCGFETSKWVGKCPSCGEWNTMKEIQSVKSAQKVSKSKGNHEVVAITDIDITLETRFSTEISEFDRVLGGGAVEGSLVLIGGAPGIGKSTLLLQMCGNLAASNSILYVSGEESEKQIKLRANRMSVDSKQLYVLSETNLSVILNESQKLNPKVMIIDSIQTIYDESINSATGSITQIRECTMQLMRYCKDSSVTVFIVGHINKDGIIAGPKILEHMVDCVVYFEGENNTSFRLLRAVKNRFGSTNEIGVFEMNENGLRCIENPSEQLLKDRPVNTPGTCVTCIFEGSRPILAEIQSLLCSSSYNPARRCNGFDYNRVSMLTAVLEKRGGLLVNSCDTYVNVIGGLDIDDPAADLACVLSIASGFIDKPLGNDIAAVGEVGLGGEIRAVTNINQRISEIARLGFKRCVLPQRLSGEVMKSDTMEYIFVKDIRSAIDALLK